MDKICFQQYAPWCAVAVSVVSAVVLKLLQLSSACSIRVVLPSLSAVRDVRDDRIVSSPSDRRCPPPSPAEAAPQTPAIMKCPQCGWDGSADSAADPATAAAAAAAAAAEPAIAYDQVPPTWDLTMSTKAYG